MKNSVQAKVRTISVLFGFLLKWNEDMLILQSVVTDFYNQMEVTEPYNFWMGTCVCFNSLIPTLRWCFEKEVIKYGL
jgi:hypothetical protein